MNRRHFLTQLLKKTVLVEEMKRSTFFNSSTRQALRVAEPVNFNKRSIYLIRKVLVGVGLVVAALAARSHLAGLDGFWRNGFAVVGQSKICENVNDERCRVQRVGNFGRLVVLWRET